MDNVILKVDDVLGREVATLLNDYQTAGSKSIDLIATNLESGFYFYWITVGKYIEMKKMLLVK